MTANRWEALCVRAAGWCDEGPERDTGPPTDMLNTWAEFGRRRGVMRTHWALSGLALFARMMSLIPDHDPLVYGVELDPNPPWAKDP